MREGVNIDGSSLDNVIEASNHDIRQVCDMLIPNNILCSVVLW